METRKKIRASGGETFSADACTEKGVSLLKPQLQSYSRRQLEMLIYILGREITRLEEKLETFLSVVSATDKLKNCQGCKYSLLSETNEEHGKENQSHAVEQSRVQSSISVSQSGYASTATEVVVKHMDRSIVTPRSFSKKRGYDTTQYECSEHCEQDMPSETDVENGDTSPRSSSKGSIGNSNQVAPSSILSHHASSLTTSHQSLTQETACPCHGRGGHPETTELGTQIHKGSFLERLLAMEGCSLWKENSDEAVMDLVHLQTGVAEHQNTHDLLEKSAVNVVNDESCNKKTKQHRLEGAVSEFKGSCPGFTDRETSLKKKCVVTQSSHLNGDDLGDIPTLPVSPCLIGTRASKQNQNEFPAKPAGVENLMNCVTSPSTPVKLLHIYKYKCPQCSMMFKSNSNFHRHVRSMHNNEERFTCVICSKVFKHKHNLKSHMRTSHDHKTQLCPHCGKLVLWARLKTHLQKVHEAPSFVCSLCGKGFLKRECLEGHLNRHMNSKPHSCVSCGRKYAYSTSLYCHKKLCKKAGMPQFLQEGSKKGTENSSFMCEACGQRFEKLSSLKDHRLAKHSSKLYQCAFCHKKFEWRPSYNRHVRKCRDKPDSERIPWETESAQRKKVEMLFVCVCGKQYSYRQSYHRHQKKCQQKMNLDLLV